MNHILTEMLARYQTESLSDRKNAVKEVMQEIVLCGLSRAGFFQKAAFYGGTALRIFYGLDRFSEDLDFSLLSSDPDFSLSDYIPTLRREVAAYGLNVEIAEKEKTKDSAIWSAFVKGNTREHMLLFYESPATAGGITGNEVIQIKFEVDTHPPAGAGIEHRYRLLPAPYELALYDMPSLFAGKVHAVICRAWKNRVKGRDLYDYVFYLSRSASLNTEHLKARLVQSGVWESDASFTLADAKRLLCDRFAAIDYAQAREDVRPFIRDASSLNLWSADFFCQITEGLR